MFLHLINSLVSSTRLFLNPLTDRFYRSLAQVRSSHSRPTIPRSDVVVLATDTRSDCHYLCRMRPRLGFRLSLSLLELHGMIPSYRRFRENGTYCHCFRLSSDHRQTLGSFSLHRSARYVSNKQVSSRLPASPLTHRLSVPTMSMHPCSCHIVIN